MGTTLAKLNEKFLTGEDRSSLNESKGMLHDVTSDEALLNNTHESLTGADGDSSLIFDNPCQTPKAPPNVAKLKYDPRSPPADFNRTPIKIPDE